MSDHIFDLGYYGDLLDGRATVEVDATTLSELIDHAAALQQLHYYRRLPAHSGPCDTYGICDLCVANVGVFKW